MRIIYDIIRPIILGGLPTKHIIRLLDPKPTDQILDIGCGNGFLSRNLLFERYIGIDSDGRRIKEAKKKYHGESVFFCCEDAIKRDSYPYNKVVLYGLLHHLSDKQVKELLESFRKGTVIVTLDPIPGGHFINDLLCRLDKGRFIRMELKTDLKILEKKIVWSNSRLARYVLYKLEVFS